MLQHSKSHVNKLLDKLGHEDLYDRRESKIEKVIKNHYLQ